MIPRERQTSGGLPTAIADLPRAQTARSGLRSDPTAGRDASWEELSSCLSSPENRNLLDLAHKKGLLSNCQLPQIPGNASSFPDPVNPSRVNVLVQLLKGETAGLSPLRPEAVTVRDTDLDFYQQQAVVRSLSTPDVCLIQAPAPATTRLMAEVVTQAIQRGQRVLLVAQTPAALDRVLEAVAGREPIYALRCLGREETLETLAPAVRALTFRERSRILRERALDAARQASHETQQRLQGQQREDDLWRQLQQLCQKRDAVARELNAAEAAALRLEQEQGRQQQAQLTAELQTLRPLAGAKQKGRWWSPAYWQATFQSQKVSRCGELETAAKNLQAKLDQLTQQLAVLQASLAGTEPEGSNPAADAAANPLAPADIERLRQELADLERRGQELLAEWGPADFRPAALTCQAIQQQRPAWEKQNAQEKEKAEFLARWVEYLEQFGETLAARLPPLANLVAATPSSLAGDEHFGTAREDQAFDLLILDGAHQLSEAEVLALASRASRWLLIGAPPEPAAEPPRPAGKREGPVPRANSLTGPRRPTPPASWFSRLVRLLHCDPSHGPYRWGYVDGRLFCRLRSVPPPQRKFLESESVADQPDIELRILNQPRAEPVLAEVLFPGTTPIAQAKGFIFRELQEAAVQTFGHNLHWDEEEQRIVLRLTETPSVDHPTIALDRGIAEHLASESPPGARTSRWHTVRLDFDRGQGWDLSSARNWIQDHLGWEDLGRTILLPDKPLVRAANGPA